MQMYQAVNNFWLELFSRSSFSCFRPLTLLLCHLLYRCTIVENLRRYFHVGTVQTAKSSE